MVVAITRLSVAARFDPLSLDEGFVVSKVFMDQVLTLVIRFSRVNIIRPVLYTHHYLHAALTRRTNKARSF
jgi:hypothetical protein